MSFLTSKQSTTLGKIRAVDVENGHPPPKVVEITATHAAVLDTGAVIEPDGRVSREPNV